MGDQESSGDRPKIVVDGDWKEQVAREKEELRKGASDETPSHEPREKGDIPEASFMILVVALATQAMAALGQVPDPINGNLALDLDVAKHHIDMLGVLQTKTEGNLDSEESRYLEATLSQLRMAYVSARQQMP